MKWPHYLLWILVAVFLFSCSPTRSESPESAAKIRAQRHAQRDNWPVHTSPVFAAPIDQVQDAVVRACRGYYQHVELDDRTKHRVEVKCRTVWAGSSDVVVQLETRPDDQVMVSVASEGVGLDASYNGRSERDVSEIIRRVTDEMSVPSVPVEKRTSADRLRDLDDLHGKGLVTDDEYQAQRTKIIADL